MKLLWLSPEVPEPGGSGGAMRAHHMLAGLVRSGIEPLVVAPCYPEQRERAAAAAHIGVAYNLVPRPASQVREAAAQTLRRPKLLFQTATLPHLGWQAEVFWHEIAATVERALVEHRAIAAVVEHDFCLRWGRHLPSDLPLGFGGHNATWVQQARDAEQKLGLARTLGRAEAFRYRRMVKADLPRYTWLSAVSQADAEAVCALIGSRDVCVAPNGADTSAYADLEPGSGDSDVMLFTGTLSYPPNDDAARWLITEILPSVRAVRPGAGLRIVGRGASLRLAELARSTDGVELLGWVDDLLPVLGSAAVYVAPLRSGGGTRLKVVEALAAGRATVATSVGAEGIEVVDGEHLLLADDVPTLAGAIAGLMADPERRGALGSAGRKLARDRYDWTVIADSHAASIKEWLGA